MPDLTTMSDEELMAIAGMSPPSAPIPSSTPAPMSIPAQTASPFSSMTNEQLMQIAGISPPPQRTWTDTAKDFGKAGVKGLYTLAEIGNPGRLLERALGRQFGVISGPEIADMQRQQYIGDPEMKGAGFAERAAIKGFEMLPTAPLSGVGSAVMSGVGGETAKYFGWPEWLGQIVGGLSPNFMTEVSQPLTKAGRETMAANVLRQGAGEKGIANIMAAAPDDLKGATFAEIAQTPGAANVELAMRREIGDTGGNLLMDALAERGSQRTSDLKTLVPGALENMASVDRGSVIRNTGLPAIKAADEAVNSAWDKVGKMGQRISIEGVPDQIKTVAGDLKNIHGYSSGANRVVNSLYDEAGNPKASLTIKEWQAIRSGAGETLADAANLGRNQESALMMQTRNALDEAAEQTIQSPSMQGKKMAALREAIDITREQKQTYESGAVGDIFQKGAAGFRTAESNIPRRIIRSPESAKEFMRAFGKDPEMVVQARGSLLDAMATKGEESWPKFFNENRPQFKALFGADMPKVAKVIKDIDRQYSVNRLAQKATGRGSSTAQFTTAAGALLDIFTYVKAASKGGPTVGALLGSSGGLPGAFLGAITGKGISALAASSERQVKQLVVSAMKDAEFAKLLVSKPTEEAMGMLGRKIAPALATMATSLQTATNPGAKIQNPQASLSKPTQVQTSSISPDINTRPLPAAPQAKAQTISYRGDINELVAQQPPIVQAMIQQESAKNPRAVSPKNAQGLMQVLPGTAAEVAKKIGLENYDPFNPEHNIRVGTAYFQEMLQRYNGNVRYALMAYNMGPGAFDQYLAGKRGLPKETRDYVTKITKHYSQLVGA